MMGGKPYFTSLVKGAMIKARLVSQALSRGCDLQQTRMSNFNSNMHFFSKLALAAFLALPLAPSANASQIGQASWYGPGFEGNLTANGEVFRSGGLTAAHRYLPFGTRVRVTNLNNGRSTVVRINDRGPFVGGRVIDLSHGAAQQIGVTATGVAPVKLQVLR